MLRETKDCDEDVDILVDADASLDTFAEIVSLRISPRATCKQFLMTAVDSLSLPHTLPKDCMFHNIQVPLLLLLIWTAGSEEDDAISA